MSDLTGKTISEYQILQVTAEYEDHRLFRAYQPSQDRYVTVTVLKLQAAQDATDVARFLQAAGLAAEMSHPNLLPVYASGRTDETVYRVSA